MLTSAPRSREPAWRTRFVFDREIPDELPRASGPVQR
jgi:hypothetical protein